MSRPIFIGKFVDPQINITDEWFVSDCAPQFLNNGIFQETLS